MEENEYNLVDELNENDELEKQIKHSRVVERELSFVYIGKKIKILILNIIHIINNAIDDIIEFLHKRNIVERLQ